MSEPHNDDNKSTNASSAGSYKICWYCKTKNLLTYNFCISCGRSLFSKSCSRCSFILPIEAKFCTNCGAKFDENTVVPQNTVYNIPPAYPPYPNYAIYYPNYPFNYPSAYYFEKPKWWHLPVFYIVFCIFGLLVLSQLVTIFFLVFLGIKQFQIQEIIYVDIFTKLFQLGLIIFALKYFKGMKNFFSKKQTQKFNSKHSEDKELLSKKSMNIVTKLLYVILFVILLLAVDLYSYVIISFVKEFLNINSATSSSYSFLDTSTNQDFLLIFFWVCIFAPLHEEILFRGILQQALDRSDTSDFVHYIIQGTTFAFMHLAGDILNGGSPDFVLIHMISTFTFAVASTYLRKKFNSLIPSILLHSFSNTLSLSFNFLTTSYFTINQLNIIELAIYILPLILIPLILILLFIFGHWKISKPSAFKQDKGRNFIIKLLIVELVCNISQYIFVVIPNQMDQFLLLLLISGISFILYFIWGSKVKDLTFQEIINERTT